MSGSGIRQNSGILTNSAAKESIARHVTEHELRPLLEAGQGESPSIPRRFDCRPVSGFNTAMKTLDTPVLNRLLDPLGRILTPEVARKLVKFRFDAKAQARIGQLARKCNEGQLSADERREYETYVHAIDFIAILQAKARAP